jgi:uncharacterized protein (TIGR02147 family)
MKSITTYLDYRVFLREYYEYQKQLDSFFSYRYIAGKVGLDHGYVVKLLQEKVHIAEKYIDKFASLCHLEGREAQYFKTLVHFNKAKHENQIKILFEKLVALAGVEVHELNKNQYEFYTKWYYTAVRAVLARMKFRDDYAALAKSLSPKITESQARKAVQLLEKLGLIKKDEKGIFRVTSNVITTGTNLHTAAVRQFQRETIRLAEESLERHHKDLRDISTVTVSIDREDMQELKNRVAEFRKSIMKFANQSKDANSVLQLNVQLFPLSNMKRGRQRLKET